MTSATESTSSAAVKREIPLAVSVVIFAFAAERDTMTIAGRIADCVTEAAGVTSRESAQSQGRVCTIHKLVHASPPSAYLAS